MVDAISSVNSLNSTRCERPQLAFKGEQAPVDLEQKPDTFETENKVAEVTEEKQGMSTGKKIAIGVGSLLALVATGFGIKKYFDSKAIQKVTTEALEYLKKCKYEKSKNTGKNVQETINNILGENSGITPHTYDVSKEFPAIHVYRNFGGFKDGLVTPNGIRVSSEPYSKLISNATSHMPDNGNVPDVKNKVVHLLMADPRAVKDSPTIYRVTFISPNQNYTALQHDVLKLVEHPEKINNEMFDKICKFMNCIDDKGNIIFENHGKYENLDYDLILSAIQSMAKGL